MEPQGAGAHRHRSLEPRYREFIAFSGPSVDDEGNNRYPDTTLAYYRSYLNAIEYLKKFGYSGERAS